jgi:hypothetical protein
LQPGREVRGIASDQHDLADAPGPVFRQRRRVQVGDVHHLQGLRRSIAPQPQLGGAPRSDRDVVIDGNLHDVYGPGPQQRA